MDHGGGRAPAEQGAHLGACLPRVEQKRSQARGQAAYAFRNPVDVRVALMTSPK